MNHKQSGRAGAGEARELQPAFVPTLPRYHGNTEKLPRCCNLNEIKFLRHGVDEPAFPSAVGRAVCIDGIWFAVHHAGPHAGPVFFRHHVPCRLDGKDDAPDVLELDSFLKCWVACPALPARHPVRWRRTLRHGLRILFAEPIVVPDLPEGLKIDFAW